MKPAQEVAQKSLQEKISNFWGGHIYSPGRNNIPSFELLRQPKVVIFTLKIETPHMDGDCIEVGWTDSSMEDGPLSFITLLKPEIALFCVREHWHANTRESHSGKQLPTFVKGEEDGPLCEIKLEKKKKKTIAATAIDGFFSCCYLT